MAKKRPEEIRAEEEALARQQAQAREQELRAKEAQMTAMIQKRDEEARQIMDTLVETDTEPNALSALAVTGKEADLWQLRYMVVERLGRQILIDKDYAQADLQAWLVPYALSDDSTYVRRAAIKLLTDIAALHKAATEDAESIVRRRAILRLFDFVEQADALAALNAVSLGDPESELRMMAVLKIVDQPTLATVSREDSVPAIRKAAAQKLTSQDDLAYVAINDIDVQVRAAAGALITDATALAKAAQAQAEAAAKAAEPEPEPIYAEPISALPDAQAALDTLADELKYE
ncbi:MAG: hypothetical protein LBR73_08710 [Oscillospiraceae bacterium]|jgi:hypothetical protein|nr:hypothetical protein [Oscillospiraceae bacterium]